MRFALAAFLILPCASMADTFVLQSAPNAATVYPNGALVTRNVTIDLPKGSHDLVFPDLPLNLGAQALRLSVSGAALATTQFRDRALPPQDTADDEAITAAKDQIKAAESALIAFDDKVAQTRLASTAAEAKIAFLAALGSNESIGTDVTTLQNIAQMIERETLAARQTALKAAQDARDLAEGRAELEKDLRAANAALAALIPPPPETAQLTASVDVTEAAEITISLTYPVEASWAPVYDVYLSGDAPATIDLARGARIAQYSDENWEDVDVTLSTLQPTGEIAPRYVYSDLRRISKPDPAKPLGINSLQSESGVARSAAPVIDDVVVLEAALASFDGPGVSYKVPAPVTLGAGVDEARIALDTLSFEGRQFARANPRSNDTAFLMAAFTNTTKEPLLASEQAQYFIENALIGIAAFPSVAAGAEDDLPFGPIEDLRLSYTTLDENEGDQGFISRSNTVKKTVRMDIENLGTKDWAVEVQAAVPYTTQEDLLITWGATPTPDVTDLDDRKGVLQWDVTVAAGNTVEIGMTQELTWPDGMILR